MRALQTQLLHELQRFDAKEKSIHTLFIGGGTPSTVTPELYRPIFELLKPYFADAIEMTSEANPNSATYEWLEGMYSLGINRISFGVQSFNNEKLKLLNRAHSSIQAIEAIQNAAKIGFKNLSLDLIYATLGDTKELLLHDINTAFSLPINHLSAYALTIEEGTPFEKKPHMSKEKLSLTSWLFKEIEKRGFKQYEISNFGTYQSRHNLGYWLYEDYIGVGSGAVGKLAMQRLYPTSDIEAYIKNPLDIQLELLNEQEKKLEQFFLGLRSSIGIAADIMNQEERKRAEFLVEEGKLQMCAETFYNTNFLLSDEITLFLSS